MFSPWEGVLSKPLNIWHILLLFAPLSVRFHVPVLADVSWYSLTSRWSRPGGEGRSMIFFGGSPPHRPGGPLQRPHPIRSLRVGHRGQEFVIPWARPLSPGCHQVAICPRLAGGAQLPAQALCCGRVPGSLVGPSRNCQAGSKTHDGTESLLPPPSTARSPAPICMVRGVQALPFLSAHIVTYSHSTTWYRCMRS